MTESDMVTGAWQTSQVPRAGHRIWSARRRGRGPTVVLMHGFPDNHHLYDDVVEMLPDLDLLVFDFLGFGDSDRPERYPYTFDALGDDLDAVLAHHGVDRVVLVPHDIAGPPAVTWALTHSDRVAAMVLLNTFFGPSPTLSAPEFVAALVAPTRRAVQRVFRAIAFSRPVSGPRTPPRCGG